MPSSRFYGLKFWVILFLFLVLAATQAEAQFPGMVVDNGSKEITVFDSFTAAVIGTVPLLAGAGESGDCVIDLDGTIGFVTDSRDQLIHDRMFQRQNEKRRAKDRIRTGRKTRDPSLASL